MKQYLFGLFTFILLSAHAQVPGYMGRKLTLTYDPAFYLSWIDIENHYNNIPAVGIHFRHDLSLEYAVSTGLAVGLVYKYLPTRFYDVYQVDSITWDGTNYGYVGFSGDLKQNTNSFGIIIKNYSYRKRGSIAPVGRYKSFELILSWCNLQTIRLKDYSGDDFEANYEDIDFVDIIDFDELNPDIESKPLLTIIFGNGGQKLINDKFLFNFGWEVGITFQDAMYSLLEDMAPKAGIELHEGDANGFCMSRIPGPYFLNFTIGGGYLFGK